MSDDRKMATLLYTDYQIQSLFEGLCEQILDYKGIENGRDTLYKMFAGFESAIDMKIKDYQKGNRITTKLDKPSEEIVRICQ